MNNLIGIIAGEPNSINSEIIAKTWKKKDDFKSLNIFVVGNYLLIKKQLKSIGIKINIKKISNINLKNFKKALLIYDVPLKFNNPFRVSPKAKSKYIFHCFKIATELARKKKISGLINCPINKKETFGNNFKGITEFLAKKEGVLGKEVMLIYNKKLSVSPITTHIMIKKVSKNLSKKLIINKLKTINKFFLKKMKLKPIEGPLPGDTAFINLKKNKFNVIVGMYHDQVLSPFKALYKFDAINITIGLPYIRVSPDHGTGKDIIKKNIANPKSLIESIKFFKSINVRS